MDFASIFGLLLVLGLGLPLPLPLSTQAADRPATFSYEVIGRNNAPPSKAHPMPVNKPTRSCNPENKCRNFAVVIENSSTKVEAFAMVEMGAPLTSVAVGTEEIVSSIASWCLNKTNACASGGLRITTGSKQMVQALSPGIATVGLDIQFRSNADELSPSPPVAGTITITVECARNQVDVNFFTEVEPVGKSMMVHILKSAKMKFLHKTRSKKF